MQIIYPPLVEEYFNYQRHKTKENLDKSSVYQDMVVAGLITETGMPTKEALEKGMIKDFYEEEDLSFSDFLNLYPVFSDYDTTVFQKIAGFWENTLEFKTALLADLAAKNFDYDEALQIQMYLADR